MKIFIFCYALHSSSDINKISCDSNETDSFANTIMQKTSTLSSDHHVFQMALHFIEGEVHSILNRHFKLCYRFQEIPATITTSSCTQPKCKTTRHLIRSIQENPKNWNAAGAFVGSSIYSIAEFNKIHGRIILLRDGNISGIIKHPYWIRLPAWESLTFLTDVLNSLLFEKSFSNRIGSFVTITHCSSLVEMLRCNFSIATSGIEQ